MNNGSFFSSSFYSPEDSQSNSWSDISCEDWARFCPEQELEFWREKTMAMLDEVKKTNFSQKKGIYNDVENKLKDLYTKHSVLKKENYGTLKEYEEKLRVEKKILKEQQKKLTSQCSSLTDKKYLLETAESKLSTENKLQKEAYQKALRMCATYFDMDVSIESSSESTIVALLSFDFSKDMGPIKIVVDRNNRKIIEMDCKKLSIQEKFEENPFTPEFLYNLRQTILNNIL